MVLPTPFVVVETEVTRDSPSDVILSATTRRRGRHNGRSA
jgi:hypothetical protein